MVTRMRQNNDDDNEASLRTPPDGSLNISEFAVPRTSHRDFGSNRDVLCTIIMMPAMVFLLHGTCNKVSTE